MFDPYLSLYNIVKELESIVPIHNLLASTLYILILTNIELLANQSIALLRTKFFNLGENKNLTLKRSETM
jgi:hypothetical protein